jgi:hypothetical protein
METRKRVWVALNPLPWQLLCVAKFIHRGSRSASNQVSSSCERCAVRGTGHKSFGSEDGYGTGNHVLRSGALQEKEQVDTSRREGEANQFSSA